MNAVIGQSFQDFKAIAGMNDVKLYGGVPPVLFIGEVLFKAFLIYNGIFHFNSHQGLIHAFEQSASERAMNSIKIFPGWTSKSYDGLKEGRRVQPVSYTHLSVTSSCRG